MKLSFRVCDQPFLVNCPSEAVQLIRPLLKPFLSLDEQDQFILHLSLKPQAFRSTCRSLESINLEDHWETLRVTSWANRSVKIEVYLLDLQNISAALGYLLVKALSQKNGLLIHGAFLLKDEQAYLFLGVSGAGKSTLAGNARGFTCVHDDRVAVRRQRGRWWAYGVPMLDNHGHPGMPLAAPIAGIYVIKKSTSLWMRKLKQRSVVEYLIPQVTVPVDDSNTYKKAFGNLTNLISEVPCYRLGFEKHSDVGVVI